MNIASIKKAAEKFGYEFAELYTLPPMLAQQDVLDKPAQVGSGIFHAGVKTRLVVEAAQRLYENNNASYNRDADEVFGKRLSVYRAPSTDFERAYGLPDAWKLRSAGQIKKGDLISLELAGKRICVTAREILNQGTDREEIVYNRRRNHYFITSMVLDGTSNHKNVYVIPAVGAENG
jgi:hypothetical protein